MTITKKISNIVWIIALLVSLTGCINFKPDVEPLNVSSPDSAPVIMQPIVQPSQPVEFDCSSEYDKKAGNCGGDKNLGFQKMQDGSFQVFFDGGCYLLDSNDTDNINVVKNSMLEIKTLSSEQVGDNLNVGFGVVAVIGAIAGVAMCTAAWYICIPVFGIAAAAGGAQAGYGGASLDNKTEQIKIDMQVIKTTISGKSSCQ